MDSTGTPGASCRLAWRTQRALGSGAVLKPFSHGWTTRSNLPWSCTTPARSVGLNPGDLCHDLAGMATYSPHPERFGDGAIPLRGPRRARR